MKHLQFRETLVAGGSARPQGRARIETKMIVDAAAYAKEAPARKGGRGLKQELAPIKGLPFVKRPPARAGED